MKESRSRRFLRAVGAIILSPYRFARFALLATGAFFWVGVAAAGAFLYAVAASVPDVERWGFDRLVSHARQRVVERFEGPPRPHAWVPVHRASRELLYSIVMSEDSTFFEHEGLNYDAIFGSIERNIKKQRYSYGASTITQQVAKNLFLTPRKTIIRKLREMLLAWRLEKAFSKNQILEIYLNIAEFGPDLFGVAAASAHYFGKSAAEMNAAEGAFISLMLPSPRRKNHVVFRNRNLSPVKKKKVLRVLRDMLHEGFITPQQFAQYSEYDYFQSRQR